MKCTKCLEEKQTFEFWKGNTACKVCRKAYFKELAKTPKRREYLYKWKHDHLDRFRDKNSKYYIRWYKRNGRKQSTGSSEAIFKWKQEHPEGVKAQTLLNHQVKIGNIKRPKNCEKCKRDARIHAHHEDYNKPLEVMWLCSSCHRRIHTYKSL